MKPLLALLALASLCAAQSPEEAKAAESGARASVESLKAAVKGKEEEPKIAAIAACGDTPHALTAAAIAPFLGDASENVRLATAKALGRMTGLADAAKALHGGLGANEDQDKTLTAVFSAIAEVNNASSVAVVKDWINHRMSKRDWEDAKGMAAAIDCLGGLKWKASVTALIDLGKKNIVANGARGGKGLRAREDMRFNRSLQRLTGEKFEDMDGWDGWWKKNAGTFNNDLTRK